MKVWRAVAIAIVLGPMTSVTSAQYGPGGYGHTPRVPTGPTYRPPTYRPPAYQPPSPYGGNPHTGHGRYGNSPYQPTPGSSPFGRTSNYRPPEIPQPRQPVVVPQYEWVEYKYCTKCNKKVSDNAQVGQRCPHCRALWTHDTSSSGVRSTGAAFATGKGSRASGARTIFKWAALAGVAAVAAAFLAAGALGLVIIAARRRSARRTVPSNAVPSNAVPSKPLKPFDANPTQDNEFLARLQREKMHGRRQL